MSGKRIEPKRLQSATNKLASYSLRSKKSRSTTVSMDDSNSIDNDNTSSELASIMGPTPRSLSALSGEDVSNDQYITSPFALGVGTSVFMQQRNQIRTSEDEYLDNQFVMSRVKALTESIEMYERIALNSLDDVTLGFDNRETLCKEFLSKISLIPDEGNDFKKSAIKEVNSLRARLSNRKKIAWKQVLEQETAKRLQSTPTRRSTKSTNPSTEGEENTTVIPATQPIEPEEPDVFDNQEGPLNVDITGIIDSILPLTDQPEMKEALDSLTKSLQNVTAQVAENTRSCSKISIIQDQNNRLKERTHNLELNIKSGLEKINNFTVDIRELKEKVNSISTQMQAHVSHCSNVLKLQSELMPRVLSMQAKVEELGKAIPNANKNIGVVETMCERLSAEVRE